MIVSRAGKIPLSISRIVHIPPLLTTFSDLEWPSRHVFQASQHSQENTRPPTVTRRDDLLFSPSTSEIWIPDPDTVLQLRLLAITHTGAAGHRGREATELALAQHFRWSDDVRLFVRSCIHCLSKTEGETLPRPHGPALLGTCTNYLVQFF